MDSNKYLKSFGWKEGEALQKGGIKKPILVKHKKDKKGIGHQPNGAADAWWERLFDGQLKGLDVSQNAESGISFKQEKIIASAVPKHESPLYRMFVRGEILQGTTGKISVIKTETSDKNGTIVDISKIKTTFKSTVDTDGEIFTKKSKKDKSHKKHKSKKEKVKDDDKKSKRDKKERKKSTELKQSESEGKKSKKDKDSDKEEKKKSKKAHKRERDTKNSDDEKDTKKRKKSHK